MDYPANTIKPWSKQYSFSSHSNRNHGFNASTLDDRDIPSWKNISASKNTADDYKNIVKMHNRFEACNSSQRIQECPTWRLVFLTLAPQTTTIPEPAPYGLRLFNVRCFSLFTEYAQLAPSPGQKGLGERDHHEPHIVLTQLPCLRRDNIPWGEWQFWRFQTLLPDPSLLSGVTAFQAQSLVCSPPLLVNQFNLPHCLSEDLLALLRVHPSKHCQTATCCFLTYLSIGHPEIHSVNAHGHVRWIWSLRNLNQIWNQIKFKIIEVIESKKKIA